MVKRRALSGDGNLSVTVPTWTTILEERSGVLAVSFAIRERERGTRLFFERRVGAGLPRFGVSLDFLDPCSFEV
jgi:hypothetical protein